MGFDIDKNGNITMVQGDSGQIVINGLNTDKNYIVYFAIRDKNRNLIGNELSLNSNKSATVVFKLTGDFTDLLIIPKKDSVAIYYYGIKVCSEDNYEETLIIGDGNLGSVNTITVYPKKVEGC